MTENIVMLYEARRHSSALAVVKRMACVLSALLFCTGIVLSGVTPALADTYTPIVVTLGDSYASGEGIEPYYGQYGSDKYSDQNWLAHRSLNSWSSQLVIGGTKLSDICALPSSGDGSAKEDLPDEYGFYGATLTRDMVPMKFYYNDEFTGGTWFDVANSEALMSHIYKRDGSGYQVKHITNEPTASNRINFYAVNEPQITVFDYIDKYYGKNSVDYVLLQTGGFDFDLPFTLYGAAGTYIYENFWDASAIRERVDAAKQTWYASTQDSLKEMLYTIREEAGPQAKIILVGYPEMFSGASIFRLITASGINVTFTQTEMALLDEMMNFLDTEYQKLVAELQGQGFKNLYYVSTIDAFEGHGAYTDDSYVYPLVTPAQAEDVDKTDGKLYPMSQVSIKSLHPNEKGARVIASLVQELIDSIEIAEGRMHKAGWNKDADGYCYYEDAYTRRVNGWATYKGSYYYLGGDGIVMTSSWVMHNNKYYYVGANGKALGNTWVKYKGSYYYLNSRGNPMVNGWVKYNDNYYYMGSNGKPVVNGWVKYKGSYYYMGSNGRPTVNAWITYKGSRYYFNEKGVCTIKR